MGTTLHQFSKDLPLSALLEEICDQFLHFYINPYTELLSILKKE
jgi:hypothetical protein